jgi:hypothetical protein
MQRQLSEAGIPLLHEKRNESTWRFQFYEKGTAPHGETTVSCFALPIPQLPNFVQQSIGDLFDYGSVQQEDTKYHEMVQNIDEAVKPL